MNTATPTAETTLQAETIAATIQAVTGERPVILYEKDTARILFTEIGALKVRRNIEQLLKAPTNKVKINFLPVILPIAIKKAGLYIALIAAALIAAGYFLGRR